MSKLDALQKDLAEVLKKHGLEEFTGMKADTLADFTVTTLGSLKKAHLATLQQQKAKP